MCVMYVEIRFEPCLKDERFTMGGKGGGFDLQHVHVWENISGYPLKNLSLVTSCSFFSCFLLTCFLA